MEDRTHNGVKFRILILIDEFTRECLAIRVERRLNSQDVLEALGELMNHNHELLQELTVSSPELDHLVMAAREAGALGAKLSGGGRGGNMIALVDKARAESIAGALMSAGAKRTIITEVQ